MIYCTTFCGYNSASQLYLVSCCDYLTRRRYLVTCKSGRSCHLWKVLIGSLSGRHWRSWPLPTSWREALPANTSLSLSQTDAFQLQPWDTDPTEFIRSSVVEEDVSGTTSPHQPHQLACAHILSSLPSSTIVYPLHLTFVSPWLEIQVPLNPQSIVRE